MLARLSHGAFAWLPGGGRFHSATGARRVGGVRVLDWLLVVSLGALAFAVVFAAGFMIGINATASAGCDGPCFDEWDRVILFALGAGIASAVGVGVGAARFISRRRLATRR